MKALRISAKIIIALIWIFLIVPRLSAQWQSDVRLTVYNSVKWTLYNNKWNIAADAGNILHVVWDDTRNSLGDIYYKRSFDNGVTWTPDLNLSFDALSSGAACISSSGSNIYAAWTGWTDNDEIFFKRSTNSGGNWTANLQLTTNGGFSETPCLSSTGQYVHLVWFDDRDGNNEIYYKRSTNAGVTWEPDVRRTINGSSSRYPSVSSQGTFVHIVWEDYNGEVAYMRSTDAGVTWSADTNLSNTAAISSSPCISFSGSTVHVTWTDGPDNPFEIFYKRSTDAGVSWSANTRLTINSAVKGYPNIAAFGVNVHIVWQDFRDGAPEMYYKYSSNGGVTFSADTRLTNAPGNSQFGSLAYNNTYVHLVWLDERDGPSGSREIYYKRNPTGNNITGIGSNNNNIADRFELMQNYPNPFNNKSKIKYQISKMSEVKLVLRDVLGREVGVLIDGIKEAGSHEIIFDAADFATGIYFYTLTADGFTDTKKMILLK
jgi:hypothetical protein